MEFLGNIQIIDNAMGRVAEVGRLSANVKNAYKSLVGRVFANLR